MKEVKPMKFKDILDEYERKGVRAFKGKTLDEIKKDFRVVASVVNKRYNQITREYPNKGTTPAVRALDARGGKLSSKGLNTPEDYIKEMASGLQFAGNKTATLKGQEEYYKNAGWSEMGEAKASRMWESYRKYEEEQKRAGKKIKKGYESEKIVEFMKAQVSSNKTRLRGDGDGYTFSKSFTGKIDDLRKNIPAMEKAELEARIAKEAEEFNLQEDYDGLPWS